MFKKKSRNWYVPKGQEATEFDKKILAFQNKGEIVPKRTLIKTPEQIEGIRRSGEINTGVLDLIEQEIHEGMSTAEIDRLVYDYTTQHGAIPAPLNYEGFPKSVCTSINEVVCHGIPSKDDVLKEGDIVNVDCSTILDGYYSDSSRMFCIGEVSEERKKLVQVTREAMLKGLEQVKPWELLGNVGAAVKQHAEAHGYSVVREFGGHGIGFDFHEDPFVSHVSEPNTGMVMVPGMVFTIEPMINAGTQEIDMSHPNGWTVVTADGKDTAQWEVQVLVTEDGYELLSW